MSYADLLINWCTVERYSQVSVVVGTDGNDYYCILAHTAAVADKPIIGANYTTYWTATGGTGVGTVWVSGTAYALSLDAYGQPVKEWGIADGLGDAPCRLMTTRGREILVGAEVVIADYKLFLKDVTITEQDRVNVCVKDPAGAWVYTLYEILLVNNVQDGVDSHHKECYLRTVR